MGRSRYKFGEDHFPHFLTCTVVNWLPLFAGTHVVKIVADSLTFFRTDRNIKIFSFVIMENHVHLIAAGEQLSQRIGSFKSYTARQIVDYLKERRADNFLRLLKIGKKDYKLSGISGLGGGESPARIVERIDDASKDRLYPQQSVGARLCRGSGSLDVFECKKLRRTGVAD